ncbi:DNA repair protein RadC [Vibrio parahaemolyticus]|nr:DNA repair protein RadC [Vibrio parahaemolyticus]
MYNEHKTYTFSGPVPAYQILEKAAEIIAENYLRGDTLSNPEAAMDFLKFKLGQLEHEVFAILFLDNQNRLIKYEELFTGTINSASIYPREVVKASLKCNAAAVMLAHNHPSGASEPSDSDRRITHQLKDALALIDVRILDHIVVGEICTSFAARGWL